MIPSDQNSGTLDDVFFSMFIGNDQDIYLQFYYYNEQGLLCNKALRMCQSGSIFPPSVKVAALNLLLAMEKEELL